MGRAWPVLCLLLTACSGPPIITEVTYKIRPNSEVPSDVRLIGVTNPTAPSSIAGAEKFLGQLADMLSVELAKSYQVTGPATRRVRSFSISTSCNGTIHSSISSNARGLCFQKSLPQAKVIDSL